MPETPKTTVLHDSGYIDDIEKHCEKTPSSKKGTPVRQMEFLFEREDSLSVKSTSSYTGLNKHSGKRWFRQVTNYQYTFKIRQLKNGRKYLYIWDIPTNRKIRSHPYETSVNRINLRGEVLLEAIKDFCVRNVGPIPEYLKDGSYPEILDYYSKPNTRLISGLLSSDPIMKKNRLSLRTSDPNDIMKAFMGDHYSKKLAGLLRGNVTMRHIDAIRDFRDEFKTDWTIEYVRSKGSLSHFLQPMSNVSYVLDTFPETFRRKFFLSFLHQSYTVNDIVRMLEKIGVTKENFSDYKKYFTGDLRENHDKLSIIVREMEDVNFKKPYELDPLPEGLKELGFRLPTHNKDLAEWSNHFSNCVSGYSLDISTQRTTVLNYNNEVCLEIRDKKLVQYLGKRNQSVSPKEFWDGVDILLKYDMIDEQPNESCWGYQPVLEKV